LDEAGFYLLPAVLCTYAPVGQAPIIGNYLTNDLCRPSAGSRQMTSTCFTLIISLPSAPFGAQPYRIGAAQSGLIFDDDGDSRLTSCGFTSDDNVGSICMMIDSIGAKLSRIFWPLVPSSASISNACPTMRLISTPTRASGSSSNESNSRT
jgi:hypothetical protein